MAVSEEQRRALHERLREQLDEGTADLMLEVTVPANVELATRADIQELRAELLLSITELNGHLSLQIAELTRRMGEMDSRLGARIGEVERTLGARIDALGARIDELNATLGARIDAIGARIDAIDARLGATNERIDAVNLRLAGIEDAVAKLTVAIPKSLYRVVLPTIVTIQLLLFALAEWVIR